MTVETDKCASGDAPDTAAMVRRHPWMRALGAADQARCTRDLREAGADSTTANLEEAATALTSWRETARALSEGLDQPADWFDEGREVAVERP